MGIASVLSFVLSRVAFLGTHLVFAYWLNFMLNDPLDVASLVPALKGHINTLDSRVTLPAGKCTSLDTKNLVFDVLLFGAWWLQHSIMARRAYKAALGLLQHPLERPLYATAAWIVWFATLYYWRPISNCEKWNPFAIPNAIWAVSLPVIVAGTLLIVGLLWSLPDHVFGTSRYKYEQGHVPHGEIIRRFPYGLVRHPAASGFLWLYWALPAYTANHLLLASMWTVFILVGTLVLEEGGLRGPDEFGRKYDAYAKEVAALYPKPACIFALVSSSSSAAAGKSAPHAKSTKSH